ncbi:MAG: DegT/DnrJ/EryC1/StrS family aminotransferase [Saprospiraceae bacterium]|nr:DegT/DnrJ/EryC1/StrS family aminotransferase [Saprospiraceae bacterium]
MIQMVDLKTQYHRIKEEIDQAVLGVIESTQYIGGPKVISFKENLEKYLGVTHVIPCANGTDALQIAMMALGLKPGDEVIVPAFTYVATAEVIGLLGLTPVMTDVDPDTFNIRADHIEAAITPRTKAIVPVHLFGQSVDMEPIMALAKKHNLYVIEDNAQAIGADYNSEGVTSSHTHTKKTGTIGHFGCTSFFPSKNLGCYGDGGALMTNDPALADAARMIANHGQSKQYYHDKIGVNSRLDAIQAAILDVKLKYLDEYCNARRRAADYYDTVFSTIPQLITPTRSAHSTHVFHQYTLQIKTPNPSATRDELKTFLSGQGIPCMIYYPVPLYKQEAFKQYWDGQTLPVTEQLCDSVFSLPMHTEMTEEILKKITGAVRAFFKP